jgi:hypothetical protein
MLIYFLRGNLPWQGLKIDKKDDRYKKILEVKMNTTCEELCKGFPNEFVEFIKYTRNLDFYAKPDYNYLRGLMMNVLEKFGGKYDYWFDWNKEKPNVNKFYVEEDNKYFNCGNGDVIEFINNNNDNNDKHNGNNNNNIILNNDIINNNNNIISNNDLNNKDNNEDKNKKKKHKILKKCLIF